MSISDKPLTINFLSSTSFENSKLGRTVHWVLTVGKALIFITFAVVMGCFIYRFTLDRKIRDLQDDIEANISALSENNLMEYKIRKTQDKLEAISKIINTSKDFNFLLRKLENCIPSNTEVSSISIQNNLISFSGKTQNEIVFSAFLSALKKQEEFSSIIVDEISSGGIANPQVGFTIRIILSEKKN
jgi:Tfp pilus assembly protein PilN